MKYKQNINKISNIQICLPYEGYKHVFGKDCEPILIIYGSKLICRPDCIAVPFFKGVILMKHFHFLKIFLSTLSVFIDFNIHRLKCNHEKHYTGNAMQ